MNTHTSESCRNNRLLLLIVAIILAAVFVDGSFGALPNANLESLPGLTPQDQTVAVSALRDLAGIQTSYVTMLEKFKLAYAATLTAEDIKGINSAIDRFKAVAEAYTQAAKMLEEWKHPKLAIPATPPSS